MVGGGGCEGQMKELGVKHKVPTGNTPYVRAKQVQLVEKNPEAAIPLFWAAINEGDRVESALKDMAIVMKQLGRADEGIEAIKSFRHRCSLEAQESLDNVLLDLYKRCGRVDEQIVLLKEKLRLIQRGIAFNGKPTKSARSHGRKFQLSIEEETSRIFSNLGWAYMEQHNYVAAEVAYRKALYFVEDANKACNLGLCLMKQGKAKEATMVLENIILLYDRDIKSVDQAKQLLKEIQEFHKHEGGSKRSLSVLYNHHDNVKECTFLSDRVKQYSGKKNESGKEYIFPSDQEKQYSSKENESGKEYTSSNDREKQYSSKKNENENESGKEYTSLSDREKQYSSKKNVFLSSSTNLVDLLGSENVVNMIDWEGRTTNEVNLSHKKHRRLPVFEEIVPTIDFS